MALVIRKIGRWNGLLRSCIRPFDQMCANLSYLDSAPVEHPCCQLNSSRWVWHRCISNVSRCAIAQFPNIFGKTVYLLDKTMASESNYDTITALLLYNPLNVCREISSDTYVDVIIDLSNLLLYLLPYTYILYFKDTVSLVISFISWSQNIELTWDMF